MRNVIMLAIGGLAFLTGCGDMGSTASKPPSQPKVVRPPYVLEFDTKAAKPNPAGVTIPAIKYTATSAALERRASLVLRLDTSGANTDPQARNQMIMGSVDIPDASGVLPASYMDLANKGLGKLLADNCTKGPVKIKVALVRSSIKPDAGDSEIDNKRLSDWVPAEVPFKNPHPKC